jgi:hypothetical protein
MAGSLGSGLADSKGAVGLDSERLSTTSLKGSGRMLKAGVNQ